MDQDIFALGAEVLAVAFEDGVGEEGGRVGVQEIVGEGEDVFPEAEGLIGGHEKEEWECPEGEGKFDRIGDTLIH